MYQGLEPKTEGVIFAKRSMPQDANNSPHDTAASLIKLAAVATYKNAKSAKKANETADRTLTVCSNAICHNVRYTLEMPSITSSAACSFSFFVPLPFALLAFFAVIAFSFLDLFDRPSSLRALGVLRGDSIQSSRSVRSSPFPPRSSRRRGDDFGRSSRRIRRAKPNAMRTRSAQKTKSPFELRRILWTRRDLTSRARRMTKPAEVELLPPRFRGRDR